MPGRVRPFGCRSHRSGGETVIAAEHDRHRPFLERGERRLIQLLADLRDIADVLLVFVALFLGLGNRCRQVALVDDRVTQRKDPLAEAGDSEGGWPHVDAAPVAAEVQRDADDVDGFQRSFTVTDMPSVPGETIVVSRAGLCSIAPRKSAISERLLTTLCARKMPLGRSRGTRRSRKRL